MTLPNKASLAHTYILTLLFCLPLAGTMELSVFMVSGQIIFMLMVLAGFRREVPSVMGMARHAYPTTFYLFLAWLVATFFSLSIIFTTPTNGWQKLFAVARQTFILVQIGFCIALVRFHLASGKPFQPLLLSFTAGVLAMACLHFAVLYWGPACDSEAWLKDPFLSPNMRDIGDLTSVAIAVSGAIYWLGRNRTTSAAALISFTFCWAYLLWSGGRAAIASTLLVNLATLALCITCAHMPTRKAAITAAALGIALLLCAQLSIYDWNGIVRFSTDWKPGFNPSADVTSGRMDMWKWSIEAFLQKPWFGLGTYSFFFVPARYQHEFWHDHPHNLVIQCLIEWGIVGTTLLLALLLSLAFLILRQPGQRAAAGDTVFIGSTGGLLILSLGSLVGGSYWDYQPVMMLTTLFACLLTAILRPAATPGRS